MCVNIRKTAREYYKSEFRVVLTQENQAFKMTSAAVFVTLTLVIISGASVGSVYVRLLGDEISEGKGELQLLSFRQWTRLCAGSMGLIEGHFACQELGFGLLQKLGTVEEPAESENFLSVTSMECSSRLAVRDSPEGLSLRECDSLSGMCDTGVYLECSVSYVNETVVVQVDNSSTSFTIVSPEDGVYVADCSFSETPSCSGIFYFPKTMPTIQSLISKLMDDSSCSRLGPIDFDPCASHAYSISCSGSLLVIICTGLLLTLFVAN